MSREFHEKIAVAIEELFKAEQVKPAPQAKVAHTTPSPVADRYARMTGEALPDEVAGSPAAVEALRKMATASGQVNELGDPSDRPSRGVGSRPTGRTRQERIASAYDSFGTDLANSE